MKMEKANFSTDGVRYEMGISVSKVDRENRLVHGWASLDNEDKQDDRVLADASLRAFQKFRGNIREMHQPVAVGRMVSFKPEVYYDQETKKQYNGVFVTAYVSKGAPDTWEKVLDGTLSAFSIKGPIKDSEMEFRKDAGGRSKAIRIIKDYELEELSLVDSGGNQLANVVSITKSDTGQAELSGEITTMKSENVFWCGEDTLAKTSSEDSLTCPLGHEMENIGWFEYNESDRVEKMQATVENYLQKNDTASSEGGVNSTMSKKNEENKVEGAPEAKEENLTVEQAEEVHAADVASDAEAGEALTLDEAEEIHAADVQSDAAAAQEEVSTDAAADVSEVEGEDVSKMLKDLSSAIETQLKDTVTKIDETVSKSVGEVDEKFDALEKRFEAKFSELAKDREDLIAKVNAIKAEVDGVQKSLSSLDKSTAVKKSGDLGGSTEELSKSNGRDGSAWGGAFLGVSSLDN